MSLKEFRDNIQKKNFKGKFKIRNSFGVYDVYKALRKAKWKDIERPLTEHEFYSIIRGVNNLLAIELSNGETFVLPARMGKLELRKREQGVSIVNNQLKNTYPINWADTIKLWYEDSEAKANKTLVRKEDKVAYYIKYNKGTALYQNKTFYQFTLNRFIKRALHKNIIQGKIDSLW